MKFRNLLLVCLFVFCGAAKLSAQNVFTEKIDVMNMPKFCMDCGTPKANCDSFTLAIICHRINYRYNFKDGSGTIAFQVLVKSTGISCVLSHNDITHSALTNDLIIALNTCIWSPALENGIPVNASVNVLFTIANGRISAQMQRMDLSELRPPDNPTVYNKQFNYSNPSLKSYNLTVYNKYNSPLPDNMSQICLVDKTDVLWYASAQGLTRFDGTTFNAVNETNSPFSATTAVHTMDVDKDNNKWMYAKNAIYKYNAAGWQVFDTARVGITKPYRIVTTATGEVFFPNSKGLLILRGDKIRLVDKQLVWQLPTNNIFYAFYDSKDRLWIGTARGTVMIDKKQNVTEFNTSNTPLENVTITNAVEDEKGNIYFSLYAYKKAPGDNDEEGIAVMSANGKWSHYNDKNSGMPANHVNNLFYDKFEKVLWVGTHEAGLVRFDLKDGWENYHNNNSGVPGPDVYQITQDSKGTVYAATANGLLKITRK